MLETTSRIIWYNLSLQMHSLDNTGQHPVQRNLNSVQCWGICHFPEEVIPTVDYSHCEIFSSCPVRISPGMTCTHYLLCFSCDSLQKGSIQLLCSHPLNAGTVFNTLMRSPLSPNDEETRFSHHFLPRIASQSFDHHWTFSSLSTPFLRSRDQN